MMHSFEQLAKQFEERFGGMMPFPGAPGMLYGPCRYILEVGGKRIRPVLCLMGNELFDTISEDAWHAAACVELFHNFTLIHDDIMDKAPLRRGRATVHTKFGLTAGILSGDVMAIYAYQQLSLVKTALPEMLRVFNRAAIEVCEGQQWDMDFETRTDVRIDEYMHMIALKTSVLLAASLRLGALAGGATEGNAEKLYEFGRNLGIAFQLQDDYLDAFGLPDKTGKQNGGDIRDNKKTVLLLTALEQASPSQRAEILQWMERDSPGKVEAMLALFRATGADGRCREMVAQYSDKAFACLEDVAVVSRRKEPLMTLARYLLQREH